MYNTHKKFNFFSVFEFFVKNPEKNSGFRDNPDPEKNSGFRDPGLTFGIFGIRDRDRLWQIPIPKIGRDPDPAAPYLQSQF